MNASTATSRERAVEGDALEDAYVRHAASALRFAYFLCGDRTLAQDLVQDAFVRVAGRLGHVRGDLGPYLRKAIVNLFTSTLRRRRRERDWLHRQGAVTSTQPAHDPGDRDELWRALQALPERQRAALVLRFYEDLSEREAARIMGCSQRALNSLVVRALQTLRIEHIGGEPS
jgi:RNA polymerase sigma factor (sigma-70 family)